MPQRFGLHYAQLKARRTKFDLKFIKPSLLSLVLAPTFCLSEDYYLHWPLFPSVRCPGRRLEAWVQAPPAAWRQSSNQCPGRCPLAGLLSFTVVPSGG